MDPGVGYGGSCFPKDVKALISTGKQLGIDTNLLEAVDTINEVARQNLFNKIVAHAPGTHIAIWGLSFKPNTDDIRFAPSVDIIRMRMDNIKKIFGDKVVYAKKALDAIPDADALVILTDWNEFKQVDLKHVKKTMKHPVIFDGRNIFDMQIMKSEGFTYYSTGRSPII
jgi:UDPglucose 6-dehydrogenase